MSKRFSSGFNPAPDNQDDPGIALLLIAAVLLVAVLSGGLELLTAAGVPVPACLSLLIGILIGLPFGALATRLLKITKSD